MTTRKERPILFSGPMVSAILADRKTVTRRLLKPQPTLIDARGGGKIWHLETRTGFVNSDVDGSWPATMTRHHRDQDGNVYPAVCPYGAAGDRLWVKETLKRGKMPNLLLGGDTNADAAFYAADGAAVLVSSGQFDAAWTWKRAVLPSIHMPRWASRLTLAVVSVRVERLQDIAEEDILREGVTVDRVAEWCKVPWSDMPTLHGAWRVLWEHINGIGTYSANPWVWRVEFRRVETA